MSMGNSAQYVDDINEEVLREIAPAKFEHLEFVIDETGDCWDDLARGQEYYDIESYVTKQTKDAYEDLIIYINEKTGMQVIIGYHEAEDSYDEVDGIYWNVLNRMVPNPEIPKSLHEAIERKFFVVFG